MGKSIAICLIQCVVLIVLVSSSAVARSVYIKRTVTMPDALVPTSGDSVLSPRSLPIIQYPEKALSSLVAGSVWLRVNVGKSGLVERSEVVYCDQPGFGFEDAAKRSIRQAIFTPVWNEMYPVSYVGYYQIVFRDPRKPRPVFRLRGPVQVKSAGYDAPIIEPDIPGILKYPKKALDRLVEGNALVRILVDVKGRVRNIKIISEYPENFGLGKAASMYIRKSRFPIMEVNGRKKKYSAYTYVSFTLSDDQLLEADLPLPDEFLQYESLPTLLFRKDAIVPQEALDGEKYDPTHLAALVDSMGRVVTTRLMQSSGLPELDSAALNWAMNRRYSPAIRNGSAVAAWARYKEEFLLLSRFNIELKKTDADTDATSIIPPPAHAEIEQPEIQPKFAHFEPVLYPVALADSGITGRTKIAAVIGEQGQVLETRIVRSSGHQLLDSLAEEAAWNQQFTPAMTEDQPVKAWTSWLVKFEPDSKDVFTPGRSKRQPSIVYPKMIHIEQPKYPLTASEAGQEGTVWLSLYVGNDGRVEQAELLRTCGYPLLDSAALEVTPLHRFTPATQDGKPISFWMRYKVEFSLEEVTE